MFSGTAQYYDLIYSAIKDYAAESARIADLIRTEARSARRVLDVACGTGEHARLLAGEHGFHVEGLDLNPEFVRIAQAKLGAGRVHQADMASFELGRRYDAVLCLFSSIGYLQTLENVVRALRRFNEHLADGGVIIVEPWLEPGAYVPGRFFVDTAEADGVAVCRMGHGEVVDAVSRLRFEYLIGRDSGIERASEVHELGLFTRDEMLDCFRTAGLQASFDARGLIGRGLYIARRG